MVNFFPTNGTRPKNKSQPDAALTLEPVFKPIIAVYPATSDRTFYFCSFKNFWQGHFSYRLLQWSLRMLDSWKAQSSQIESCIFQRWHFVLTRSRFVPLFWHKNAVAQDTIYSLCSSSSINIRVPRRNPCNRFNFD